MADGRYSGYLTALGAAKHTVTWDQFQFLTGEDAKRAWAKEHPGESPLHDYYIVDDDPGRTTLPVAADVQVKVHDLSDAPPRAFTIDYAQMPSHIANDPIEGDDRLWPMPFWFTVSNGKVTAIDEQYMP